MSEEEEVMDEVDEVSPSAETETAGQTSPAEIMEGAKAWSAVAKSFLYVEVASLVLMFSCIGVWVSNSPYLAYAISVAVISLAACLIIQTGEFVKPGLLEKVEKPVSLFLFIWWAVGTGKSQMEKYLVLFSFLLWYLITNQPPGNWYIFRCDDI